VAQSWANGCRFEHNTTRGQRGENLYASSQITSVEAVIASWASEASDYSYATNTCAQGEVCGHYTQLVWRATTSVGCGVKTCQTGSPFSGAGPEWQLWVCNYSPPGNISGQRPY
jgi:hypothetical protein